MRGGEERGAMLLVTQIALIPVSIHAAVKDATSSHLTLSFYLENSLLSANLHRRS
ncbi:hypothetical protein SBC1_01110 [Caballeronia sp. SBC1]|nr:hypothetical protein SBC1_01110 [Caballeronia sp. SBC1]